MNSSRASNLKYEITSILASSLFPSSHHVYVTLWVTPPCPTLSADTEPLRQHQRLPFLHCAHCDETKSAL